MQIEDFKYGCQTFTWEMLGPNWTGNTDDLIDAISEAGYQGIEITDTMIGSYSSRPKDFRTRLNDAGLVLVAMAYGSRGGFTEPTLLESDLESCKRWVDFAAHFPGATVSMGSATVMSEGARSDKFDAAAKVYNLSAEIGLASDVTVALHPSSHQNTLLFSREDYDEIFTRLSDLVGWIPDTGHILRAKQDILDVLNCYRNRICYLHLKDVDTAGNWSMLGQGVCDIPAITAVAKDAPRFSGWIVVEEESKAAAQDPNGAVKANLQSLTALTQNF